MKRVRELDKTKLKSKIAEQIQIEQLEDLQHLQEKKKRLNRSVLYKSI